LQFVWGGLVPGARLTLEQRRVIENGKRLGLDQVVVAALIGKHPSTVSRELRRRVGGPIPARRGLPRRGRPPKRPGEYSAEAAHRVAIRNGRRPKRSKLVGRLGAVVSGLLESDWSPEQIAAKLPGMYPDDPDLRVSAETIYQSLFVQGRGELRRELTAHLRTGRTARKPQGTQERRGKLTGTVSFRARPAEAEDRAVPGHWEGDLLLGAVGQGGVITLVERTSRFVLLAPLPGRHDAATVRDVLTSMIARLPTELKKSLTWDQGKEMAEHARFTVETDVLVFFCDPHSPWQRGSNENTNGLLRQYWPKGADLRHLTQAECDAVALRLNTRPRKTLAWHTPAEALNTDLIATAA
jgi:transposase, IS30 family